MSLMLVAPSAIAAAIETSTIPLSMNWDVLFFLSAPDRPAVSPVWSAALRSRMAPACPTRPFPSAVTFRAWSHPLCCMAKSAPAWKLLSVVTGNLPGPGRSSPFERGKRKGTAAPRPSPSSRSPSSRSARTHKVHAPATPGTTKPQATETEIAAGR